MKGNKLKYLQGGLSFIFMIIAIFCSFGTGMVFAMAATAAQTIDETVTTESLGAAASTLLRPEISKVITQIRRDVYPLDTIMREIGRVSKIESSEWKYYQKDERGIQDTVNGAYTFNDAVSAAIVVDHPEFWTAHDIALFPQVLGGDSKKLRCMVSAVNMTTSEVTFSPINGRTTGSASVLGTKMPTVDNDFYISRIGNAHGETDAQTDPIEIAPYDTLNYSQIFMAQVEESLVNKIQLKEVDINIMDYKEDALIDMRAQAEFAMLFGYPKKDHYDPVLRKKVNLVGGADYFITKEKQYTKTVAITNATFNAWAKYVFAGNNGSDKRILWSGNNLLERMMNADIVEKQITGNQSEYIAGVRFTKIETAFGIFLVRKHQGFEEVYGYSDNGLVMDMEYVERGFYEATKIDTLDLDKTGQKRVDAKRILENWSMKFTNLDTHCWIKGV
jgi:hypothetical protein